jgi:LysM repeat protein
MMDGNRKRLRQLSGKFLVKSVRSLTMKKHWRKGTVVALLVLVLLALSISGAAASGEGGTYHKVQAGETLFSIGRLYGVNPYSIAAVNHLVNPNCIYAGQVLYVPSYDQRYPGNDCGYGCGDYGRWNSGYGQWNGGGYGQWNGDGRGQWNNDGRGQWNGGGYGQWNSDGRGQWYGSGYGQWYGGGCGYGNCCGYGYCGGYNNPGYGPGYGNDHPVPAPYSDSQQNE